MGGFYLIIHVTSGPVMFHWKKNLEIYKWGERMSNNKTKTYNAMYHNFFANGYVGKLTRTILSFTLYDGYKPLFPFR